MRTRIRTDTREWAGTAERIRDVLDRSAKHIWLRLGAEDGQRVLDNLTRLVLKKEDTAVGSG